MISSNVPMVRRRLVGVHRHAHVGIHNIDFVVRRREVCKPSIRSMTRPIRSASSKTSTHSMTKENRWRDSVCVVSCEFHTLPRKHSLSPMSQNCIEMLVMGIQQCSWDFVTMSSPTVFTIPIDDHRSMFRFCR